MMVARVLVGLVATLSSAAGLPALQARGDERIRVACVGDSITYGFKIPEREKKCYPARLQELLGERYEVRNFGVSGAGVCRSNRRAGSGWERSYLKQPAFRSSLDYKPHLVVINLGINDIGAWEKLGHEFVASYLEIIAAYRALATHPAIYICHELAPLFAGQRYYGDANLARLNAAIATVAVRAQVATIDLHGPLANHPELFPDHLHPDAAGALLIAEAVQAALLGSTRLGSAPPGLTRGYAIAQIDLDGQRERQVVVDREKGQYLGHPTTCLLEDGRTLLCVYPKGHGRGAIVYKRSRDGGLSWSGRLPVPASWATSKEVPTLHRVVDAAGRKRIIMWSGLHPARLAVSADDGASWSELRPVGPWGGIVVMGFVAPLHTGEGHYLAMFHDDGRFFLPGGKRGPVMTLYKTFSRDGGLTWSYPEAVFRSSQVHLCEPGCIRSPDGKRLAVLLRENRRRRNSHIVFSSDEGRTWSAPRELPLALCGDRHTGRYGPGGRLFISFRCNAPKERRRARPFEGDWVGWVGTWEDLLEGREGQYQVRLKHNTKGYDTAYPAVEVLPDGTFVTTTYGHWEQGEAPYILSVRFKLNELDAQVKSSAKR